MYGFAYIGVLSYLQAEGLLRRVRHIAGASIGALFGLMVALDLPAAEMERLFKELAASEDLRTIPRKNLMGLVRRFGIDDGHRFVALLEPHCPPEVTFLELAKRTGRNLAVSATCAETMTNTVFSVDRTPQVRVLDALRASMGIPMLVAPVLIDGLHYIDGAVTCGFPVSALPPAPEENILGLYIRHEPQHGSLAKPMDNIVTYFLAVLATYLGRYVGSSVEQRGCGHLIVLDGANPLPLLCVAFRKRGLCFAFTPEDIDRAIAYGYTRAYETLHRHLAPRGAPRDPPVASGPLLRLPAPEKEPAPEAENGP